MIGQINRYSDISCDSKIIIDNYNCHTDNICIIEKICFLPVYRVFGRNRKDSNIIGEKYFMRSDLACQYWSQLVAEKEYLF